MVRELEAGEQLKVRLFHVSQVARFKYEKTVVFQLFIHLPKFSNWIVKVADNVSMVNNVKFLAVERGGSQRRPFTKDAQTISYEIGLDIV